MNKKGFTLIELLAVIVILAIIALIAVPRILNIVENARKGAAESSALGWIDAVEKQSIINELDSTLPNIIDGTYEIADLTAKNVKVKGQKPSEGWVQITKGKVTDYSLVIGNYTVTPKDGDVSKPIAVKGNNVKDNGDKVIYSYSENELYTGDKIDLKNKTVTNYLFHNYRTDKLDTIDETHDMAGIFSTNINDVLNISKNTDGTTTEPKNNVHYIKYTVNSDGIIQKAEVCLVMSWGTWCETGRDSADMIQRGDVTDYKFKERKTALLDFLKWDTNTNKSAYEGVTCDLQSSSSVHCYFTSGISISMYGHGNTGVWDSDGVGCEVYPVGSSNCYLDET